MGRIVIYVANISTPKDTAKTTLKKTSIRVTKGLVYKVEFYFPSGSAGLMGVAVFDGLFQVWPSTVGEFFLGEDHVVSFDDLYLKERAPFQFQCYTYNTDDTYEHAVSVRIGFVSKEVFQARFLPSRGQDYLTKLLENIAAEQQELASWQRKMLPETPFEWMLGQKGKT